MSSPDPHAVGGGASSGEAKAGRSLLTRPAPRSWLLGVVLIAITFAAYQPVWQAGFIWDDDVMLTRNPFVQSPEGLREIWWSTELPDYFPLTSTALWLQWKAWGPNPLGYHLVNVLLHGLAAVMWWRVLRRLLVPGAWVAAAAFALHPVNVESVAWITEIKNTLAMAFYAATLWAYLRFEHATEPRDGPARPAGHGWYVLAVVAFALALLSKTAVAPLPVALLGLAWWRRGRIERVDVWRSLPFFALSAALAAVTMWFHHHRAIAGTTVRDDDFLTRLAGAGWAVWFYLTKALLPINLIFVYPRWEIDGTNVLVYLPAMLVLAGFALAWKFSRAWGRSVLFVSGYFVALLLPVLGFIDISYMRHSFVADRWQYFAIIAPVTAIVAVGAWALRGSAASARVALGGVVLALLGGLTWRQSRLYVNVDTLWQTTLARNPQSAVAHNEVGTGFLHADKIDEAIAHYHRALALMPDYALAHHNLGAALLKRGDAEGAIARFRIALSHQKDFQPSQHYLGRALLETGQVDAALHELQVARELQPDFAETHYYLGAGRLQKGEWESAAESLRRAIALEPGAVQAHNDLGVALVQGGRVNEALGHFQRALELDPSAAAAHNNVGKLLWQTGRAREAIAHYEAALRLQADDPDTLANLAWALATAPDDAVRRGFQALVLAQRAAQRERRDDPAILRSLAAAYAETGRFPEAIATARRALGHAHERGDTAYTAALANDVREYERGAPRRESFEPAAAPTPRSP